MISRALAFAALLAACTPPAPARTETTPAVEEKTAAAPLVDGLFTDGACYLATYDAAHLAAHPQQTVTTFLITDPGADVRPLDTDETRHVGFAFQIKDDADIYTGLGGCSRAPASAACFIEGDGGEFTLTPTATGLRITIARMEVEGPERFAPDLAQGDNRIIDLTRTSGTDCLID